jgi:hypothetical protein
MTRGDTQDIGAAAADALPELHAALYGFHPRETRAWTDGNAILIVARTGACTANVPGRSRAAALAELQRSVRDVVYLRCGVMLRMRDRSVDAGRELIVLAFERSRASDLAAERFPALHEPLADAS